MKNSLARFTMRNMHITTQVKRMHSSRMRAVRSSGRPRGGVSATGGCLLPGKSAPGGCLLWGSGVVFQHALRQTPPRVDRHMPVKS